MDFVDALRSRRSCRDFRPDPLDQSRIGELIDAARWAPSPLNLQPWEFVVVTDQTVKSQVRQVAESARQEVVAQGGPGWAGKYSLDFLERAPVLIAVVYDPAKNGLGRYFGQSSGALCAAAAAVENIMLAATAAGLGSLWFTFFDPARMRAILGVPDNLELAGIIPVGMAANQPPAPPRQTPRIHYQRYA